MYSNKADVILDGSGSVAGNVLSGKNINIEGGANSTGRVIMAPNGDVILKGGQKRMVQLLLKMLNCREGLKYITGMNWM